MSNICKTVSLRTRKIKDGRMLSYCLDYYPGYRQRALRLLRQGEDEGGFSCLLQETGGQEELQVAARLYALSYLHARQVYLRGDKRGLVQQVSGVSADSTTGTA